MGSFYVNVTVLDVGLDAVRTAAPRPSFVGAAGTDPIVYAAADDAGAPVVGAALTDALGCTGISVGVHDDDILFWEVHRAGETIVSGAVPDPAEVFGLGDGEMAEMMEMMGDMPDAGAAEEPEGSGDLAADLVAALGRGDVQALGDALAADHTFATDRHVAFVDALGLPRAAVGWGYRYIEAAGGEDELLGPVEHLT